MRVDGSEGCPVYSAAQRGDLAEGGRLLEAVDPILMYLSTSDYVQHTPPGDDARRLLQRAVDRSWQPSIDRRDARRDGGPRDERESRLWGPSTTLYCRMCGRLAEARGCTVILPVTDHTSCTWLSRIVRHVYVLTGWSTLWVAGSDTGDSGVDCRCGAVRTLVSGSSFQPTASATSWCLRRNTVVGTRPADHDLSALKAPLRSHGGRAEQEVPMFATSGRPHGGPPAA